MVNQNKLQSKSYESFLKAPFYARKHLSYFSVYDDLFSGFRGQDITFIEVGVWNGGSLFMWRDYFGEKARIIGVDINESAKQLESQGFEIFIGDQSDPSFWKKLFAQVGSVDIVLDDGGHQFDQQIITCHECFKHVKDGGLVVVEDAHTSYMRRFGYPTKYSFIGWAKRVVDNLNCRFPGIDVSRSKYDELIYSVQFFESIVSFKVDRKKCIANEKAENTVGQKEQKHFLREPELKLSQQSKVVKPRSDKRPVNILRSLLRISVRFFRNEVARLKILLRLRKIRSYF